MLMLVSSCDETASLWKSFLMEESMDSREDLTAVAAAAIEPLESCLPTTTSTPAPSLAVSANGLDTITVQTVPQPNASYKKEGCRVAVSDGDGNEDLPKKRAKISHGWVQTVLRQTAEMVMVLAGMGAMRAGCSPTPIECQLAMEAYEKLASLVENVAPQQLVSQDAYHSLLRHFKVDPPVAPQPKIAKPVVIHPPAVNATDTHTSAQVGATESTSQDPVSKDGDKQDSLAMDKQGKPLIAQTCNWSKEAATLPSAEQHDTHQQLALGVQLLTKNRSAPISSVSISNVYLSPPVACGGCKLLAHNTSSVLVCDGCESAFHIACLQLYDPKLIPWSDWYCPKCVTASGGRPQPPKYGPLRHGHGSQGSTRGSWGLQAEKSSNGSEEQVAGKSLLLYKKETGAEVPQGPKELVGMNLDSALDSTIITAAGAPESKAVVYEQRDGDCPAGCHITASPSLPAPQLNTETVTRMTTTTSEAVIVHMETPSIPKTSGGKADVMTRGATIEEAPHVVVTCGKGVSRKDSTVKWVGSVVNVSQGNVYYAACSVAGVTIRLQDCALFRPESPQDPPYIARLQALWEEKSTGAKWVKVNWCYYQSDLPVETGPPPSADDNEVYESNHSDNNLVASIHGPCQVLPPVQYQQEMKRRSKETSEALAPIFLCRWFYDAPRGLFRACSGVLSD